MILLNYYRMKSSHLYNSKRLFLTQNKKIKIYILDYYLKTITNL